jgi:hypothetical protein
MHGDATVIGWCVLRALRQTSQFQLNEPSLLMAIWQRRLDIAIRRNDSASHRLVARRRQFSPILRTSP